jgi:hypothetical protein
LYPQERISVNQVDDTLIDREADRYASADKAATLKTAETFEL